MRLKNQFKKVNSTATTQPQLEENTKWGTSLPPQDILPFPPTPSASIAGRTMQESVYKKRIEPQRLPADAPNILIVLIDDAGPGLPSPLGGEIHTPTLERILKTGVGYNRFHTTAMCSPTRASLLSGRNHHAVSAGQIAEFANDFDAYSGIQPKSAAMIPEILKNYGYSTGAWGKWHNTPANQTTATGPFDYWPTGYGFEYFYGFLGAESSQYEPNLYRNTSIVAPPKTPAEGYHLSEDLANNAIAWLQQHRALQPKKPFFMYWASGAVHGPHHIWNHWADKYKGKFDSGWDEYRERVLKKAKEKGWIPQNAQLTPRPPTMPSWDSIPESQKPFQRRLMEVFAGFCEHVDTQVGRVVDEVERLGYGDNTLIFYIWGDNGSSAEGQNGTISELLTENGISTTIEQHLEALEKLGGLNALGTPKTDNMYHACWAWAGSTPYKSTKLIAAHFGGTRNPMIVRWPSKIKPDASPRTQFHHCIDIAPTLYEILGITPPRVVNGIPQDKIHGVSLAYSLNNPTAEGRLMSQYFEIMGSRGIYHNGWFASAFGPRIPWIPGVSGNIKNWTPDSDPWELYNLEEDWSQANDLAAQMPEKLAQMKELFTIEFARNNAYPVGGGLWVLLHPEDLISSPSLEWTFSGKITRIPEIAAPKLGNTPNIVTIDAEIPNNTHGVLYALGGFGGGLTCYMDDGYLAYEYNLFMIQRTKLRSAQRLPHGKVRIEIKTTMPELRPGGPLEITIKANGTIVVKGQVPASVPLIFSTDCFDIGICQGSPVSEDYFDRAPFEFNGTIDQVHIQYVSAGEKQLTEAA